MKTLVKTTICILSVACIKSEMFAQSLDYKVFVGSKSAGTLQIQKNNLQDDAYRVRLESNTEFTFVKVSTLTEAEYRGGRLYEATTVQKLNGKVRVDSKTTLENNQYKVNADGDISFLKGNITCSVAMLYLLEPIGMTHIFSERYGKFCDLEKIAPHSYELQLPDGKTVTYTYEDGVCKEMHASQALTSISVRLADN